MTNIHPQHHRGFTLVEILIYIGVMTMLLIAAILTIFSLDDSLLRNKTERAITNAAVVTLERIGRDIRAAESANALTPGELMLVDGATTTVFALNGSAIEVTVNGTLIGPLTPSDVIVEDLDFTHYVGAQSEMVRAALTLHIDSKAASTTKTYYIGGVLRGTYE